MTIIIFGSINIDLVAKAPHLPKPGETLLGSDFFTAPGGKGANQAVAAAKLGVTTHIVGRVGGDSFGTELINSLQASGVQTDNVMVDNTTSSGVAVITVDDAGENNIVVIPGANGRVNQEDIGRLSQLLPSAKVLLLQLEIPISSVIAAAKAAKEAGVTVILDPAPARSQLPEELYPLVDIITPNEVEASELVGFKVDSEETAKKAAKVILQKGVKTVIIKLGAKGAFCALAKENFYLPALSVQAIDTTACGDAFNGAFAAALSHGLSLQKCVTWGMVAGALAATKQGAQPSLPDRESFDRKLGVKS